MTAVESSVPVAKKLATEGPAGAVKEITEEAGDLKATILEKLTSYLIPTVIIAGITWIISLLNPASAFVRAVKGIIDIVTFIVNQGAQIVEFVNAVLDAVITIANGGSAGRPENGRGSERSRGGIAVVGLYRMWVISGSRILTDHQQHYAGLRY
ncbi:hypothetical protein OG195_44420 (plasmid) [Streptomyces sp. NBC_01362]|uniref:hypothetical protein n=1 Tax=Streptomyces sp. NBC_01362 TaxID=2903839 RepID=UPI002E332A3D|nr:hypothetical protein [Streptomyces sp. NBC_01362]